MKKIFTLLFLVVGLSATAQTFDFTCASSTRPTLEDFTFSTSLTHNGFTNFINTGASFTLFDNDVYTGYGSQTWDTRTDSDTLAYLDNHYFVAIEYASNGAGTPVAIFHARASGCCQLTLSLIEGRASTQATLFLLE